MTTAGVLNGALEFAYSGQTKRSDEMRVGAILQRLGWAKKQKRDGQRRYYAYEQK